MMCPVCKRDLAPTLSICLTCGAMMNDTVREELETKITPTVEPVAPRVKPPAPRPPVAQTAPKIEPPPAKLAPPPPPAPTLAPPKPIAARFDTADLRVKKTSPTLVEFQTKKATVPEWRLQLQNSVRQKVGPNRRDANADNVQISQSKPKSTSGANALKVEFVEEEQPSRHQNPRVASALKRIEESRRVFSNQPVAEQSVQVGGKPSASRNFPFNVVARSNEASANTVQKATVNASPKPMLVSSLKIEQRGFDTNKLPPLPKQANLSNRLKVPAAKPVPPASDARVESGRILEQEK